MKKVIGKVTGFGRMMMNGFKRKLISLARSEDGIDIIIMIVVLAILMAIAIMFRDVLMDFVNKLFDEILAF